MSTRLLTSEIRTESDVVLVRQRARQIAVLLEFDAQEQTRISTAVSEIARNAFLYASGGRAEFCIEGSAPAHFIIRISDHGQGIADLPAILAGTYRSETGMGLGLAGAKKLMDTFRADSVPGRGATVELGKALPAQAPRVDQKLLSRVGDELARLSPTSPMEEIREQNIELLRAFDELRSQKLELDRSYGSERAARAEAEAAVAARDELLAIVSHDLRNPLSAILTGAAVLNRTTSDGAQGELVHKSARAIIRSAERMNRIIADLLDLAQIEAGQLAVEQKPEDVAAIVREGIEMLHPLAVKLELKLDGSVSAGLRVHCDRGRVLQIVSNLVGNALKFTPKGGAIVIDAQALGSEAHFYVRDSGRGISEEDLSRIFDRFWHSSKNNRQGIGLGLSIVKGLVEAQNGRVWVESALGVGTTFFFTLPLAKPMPEQLAQNRPESPT
jgi:signal transduction histidine kinase